MAPRGVWLMIMYALFSATYKFEAFGTNFFRQTIACDEFCVGSDFVPSWHVCCLSFLALCEDVPTEDMACDILWMFPGLMFSSWMYFLKILLLRNLQDCTFIFYFRHQWTTEAGYPGSPDLWSLMCLAEEAAFFSQMPSPAICLDWEVKILTIYSWLMVPATVYHFFTMINKWILILSKKCN